MNNIKEPPAPEKLLKKEGGDIRRMFASIAPTYDLLNRLLSLGFDRRWRERAVELSELSEYKDTKVLDICTGTADLAIAYSQKLGPGGQVVGSDFCWEMLARAPSKLKTLNTEGGNSITLVQADALHLPFPDNSFHVVSVAFGIRNVSDLRDGIKEMARVIMPGGRVVILEFGLPESRAFKMAYNLYFNQVLPRVGNLIAAIGSSERTRAYTYLPASVGEFPNAQGLRELMESLGLTDVASHPLSMGIANVHVGKKISCQKSSGKKP
ncbi:MAG: bifunctional demethylmenaquinone methyltransferase/2-methoxy-6-polyprenyl-1,4-benzoquinol methylase UbiE [Candidatus Brocadiales bacterium]